jgi:hypothetical protein
MCSAILSCSELQQLLHTAVEMLLSTCALTCTQLTMCYMATTSRSMCCLRRVTLLLCTDTLADAGCNESDLLLAKLLRKRGAVWPDQLGHSTLDRCWCAAAVAWARAEGCAAPALAVDADDGADDGDY